MTMKMDSYCYQSSLVILSICAQQGAEWNTPPCFTPHLIVIVLAHLTLRKRASVQPHLRLHRHHNRRLVVPNLTAPSNVTPTALFTLSVSMKSATHTALHHVRPLLTRASFAWFLSHVDER
jgi:hypothetical protein